MAQVPFYVQILFTLTSVLTLGIFYWAIKGKSNSKASTIAIAGLLLWIIIQSILSLNNVYSSDTDSVPPKIFLLGILPTIITMLVMFLTRAGRSFIDDFNLERLTYLHAIRVPVEIGLYLLFALKVIPEIMTFAGWNFDILAGITAPIVAYYGIKKRKFGKPVLLFWNVICLLLVLGVFIAGTLSAPSPFQQLGLEQPNIGLLYFPFSLLPTFIVPLVVFLHLVAIRLLMKSKI